MMKDPRTPSRRARMAVALAFTAALAACGGGGDDEAATSGSGATAEGVYGGTLTGSSNAFQLLVLENGEFWALYGIPSASTFGVTGFLQGAGTSSNGTFTAASTKDFGFIPAVSEIFIPACAVHSECVIDDVPHMRDSQFITCDLP